MRVPGGIADELFDRPAQPIEQPALARRQPRRSRALPARAWARHNRLVVQRLVPQWALDVLSNVYDPCCREKGISVVDMGLVRSVDVDEGHARVELLLTSGWCPFAARVLEEVQQAVVAGSGVDSAEVEIVWDEPWTTDRLSDSAVRKLRFLPDPSAVPDREAYIASHHQPAVSAEEARHAR